MSVELIYLNLDFAHYLGIPEYTDIVYSPQTVNAGFGDWFFRQSLFPDLEENTDTYSLFGNQRNHTIRSLIEQKRPGLDRFLDDLIDKYLLEQSNLIGMTSNLLPECALLCAGPKIETDKSRYFRGHG